MKKLIFLLIFLSLSFSLFAVEENEVEVQLEKSIDGFSYTPYQKEEFPKWALKTRRAETLFFGGVPLVFPVVSLASNLIWEDADFYRILAISASISAVIVLIDFIMGEIDEN
ncbi:MAG: hypothetical protein WC162_08245 [Sphaerochaetaceae bacterium]|nr:hypothetical protein [Sphaerochaetaceae bacterium]